MTAPASLAAGAEPQRVASGELAESEERIRHAVHPTHEHVQSIASPASGPDHLWLADGGRLSLLRASTRLSSEAPAVNLS